VVTLVGFWAGESLSRISRREGVPYRGSSESPRLVSVPCCRTAGGYTRRCNVTHHGQ